jgi:hypothetical protein
MEFLIYLLIGFAFITLPRLLGIKPQKGHCRQRNAQNHPPQDPNLCQHPQKLQKKAPAHHPRAAVPLNALLSITHFPGKFPSEISAQTAVNEPIQRPLRNNSQRLSFIRTHKRQAIILKEILDLPPGLRK